VVYFGNSSINEYIGYITYLQQQGTLLADLEYLDLEELQGVNGLKALCVGLNDMQTILSEAEWKFRQLALYQSTDGPI
jgi:hypothetical protein